MITFKCEHCLEEIEFTLQETRNVSQKAKEIGTHTVCQDCFAEYNKINAQVKEYADEKRKELEDEFFNVKPQLPEHTDELEGEMEELPE